MNDVLDLASRPVLLEVPFQQQFHLVTPNKNLEFCCIYIISIVPSHPLSALNTARVQGGQLKQ